MSSPDRESTTIKGHRFEERVATLLRLFGYDIEWNIHLHGNQIDIRAFVELPTHTDTILVECKDYARPIGVDKVREFFAIIAQAAPDVRGLFVAELGFSPEAKEFAKNAARLSLYTYRELERKVIDPAHYFNEKRKTYPDTDTANTYVNTKCIDSSGIVFESAEDKILKDEKDPDIRFIAVLGEYGSGKSTLLDHLEYRLASAYISSTVGRIPFRVNLGEYTKAFNLRQLITDLLVHRFGVRNARYDIFEDLNRQGRLLLLFDGFDEMSSRVDDVIVRENFAELQALCVDNAKVILTCRNSFFRDREEELSLLGIGSDKLMEAIAGERSSASRLYQLQPFTWEQIEKVVEKTEDYRKRKGERRINSGTILKKIQGTYNLEELAQRPFLLDMILKSIPYVETSSRTLTAGALYDIYTDAWVRRDAKKGRTLETPERRLFFAEELAYQLYKKSINLLHWRRIPDWIDEHLGIKDKKKDYYDYDVRSSNFLSRNDQGYYFFAHRSFMEFFVARKLARILIEQEDYDVLASFQFGEEIRQFMVDVAGNSLADNLKDILPLVILDPSRLKIDVNRVMSRNVLGLLRQLGPIRVITPALFHLRQSSDRGFRAYLLHYLSEIFRRSNSSSSVSAHTLLAAVSVTVRGAEIGLTSDIMIKLWRDMPNTFKKELDWASHFVLTDSGIDAFKVIDRLHRIEKGFALITTSELAYSLNTNEETVVQLLRARKMS